jgi:hypothetical protein
MLKDIWDMQLELNKLIGIDTVNDPNKSKLLFQFAYQLYDELDELEDALLEKDIPKVKLEAIDCLHFLISIWQILDINYENIPKYSNNQTYISFSNVKPFCRVLLKQSHQLQKCCLTKWWVKEYKDGDELFKTLLFKDKAIELINNINENIFSLFRLLLMDDSHIYNIYKMKYEKNIERQKNNYSIKNKTEDDNKEIELKIKE